MDSSNSSGMSGTHLQQPYHNNSSYSNFINDIEAFAADESVPGNDEFSSFAWDPALFAGGDTNTNFPQQQQQSQQPQQPAMQANLNQTLTRQSNSPALQQQHPAHQQYPPHNYGHSMYEHRNMGQPSFDDRFMSRPSASPGPFEHHPTYQQQMPFNSYGFQQPQQQQQQPPQQYQRQTSPPNPFYAQRPVQQQQQQAPSSMMAMNARQSSQTPQMENLHMHQYPGNTRVTHAFINPSMVMNGSQQQQQHQQNQQQQGVNLAARQQYAASPYFQKPGTTVDPQTLHAMQLQNYPQMQTVSHMLQQPSASRQGQPQLHMPSISNVFHEAQVAKATGPAKTLKDPTAPKKSRIRTSKVKKDGTAESDSSDDLEIEDEPPEIKPALLVVSAPTDEKGRALYNAVEAVWYPRNRSPQAEDVRKGIAAFGETVRSLRDSWKAKNDSLRKAELPNSDTASQASRLKEDVAHYRQTMESVITRSLQYGHDSIVKRLGENHFTLSALYSFLFDRANVLDYDSTLVNSIFKLAVKFETLDEEMLEQVKWSKVLQRWIKRATNESKTFAQQIVANAQAQSARKKAAKLDETPGSPASVNGTKAGVKRPRDGDTLGVPAPKKVVKPASKPLALQSAERRKAMEKDNSSKSTASKLDKSSASVSSTVASRPKVAMSAPSKANAFAKLLSASKRPGTSNAEKAAAAAASTNDKPFTLSTVIPPNGPLTTVKKDEIKKDSPPHTLGPNTAKSTTSFLGVLADMDKPKELQTKKVDVDSNESEEQRAKRVRKEARRKLRVRWKPDEELVQTKIFTHHPEEETGQTDNMMRDAGDTMKEGEMLKRHMANKDDEDDEEDEAVLEDFGEYTVPTEVDFSPIDNERAGNFIKFGGTTKAESQASDAQAKYEEDTLMTTYTFKSDRPDTPKELPSVNDDDDFQPVVDFGEPTGVVRGRERELIMRRNPQTSSTVSSGTDLAAQLRALGVQSGQQIQPQAGYSTFPQQTVPQAAAPQLAANMDLSRLFAAVQQVKQMGQAPQAPLYQAPVPQISTNIPPNIAQILAQVSEGQNQGLSLGNAGNPNPFPGNDDFSRKHGRGDDGNDQSGNKKKKKGSEGKPYNYKTITCSFWQEGKCTKGDSCTYKHEL